MRRVSIRRCLATCGLVGCVLAMSSRVRAEPPAPDKTEANPAVPFDQGRALMKAGRYAEAGRRFQESLQIRRSAGALLNLGDCYEKLGRYASAVEAFEGAQALSEEAGETGRAGEARGRASD